jgi:toxin ParE1/3/4
VTCRLSVRAEADLAAIWAYSAEQWGVDQADHYVDALLHRFSWLLKNRALWKNRPDISDRVYSYPNQSQVIYFRTFDAGTGGGLEILRILHGRMDPSGQL